MRLVWLLAAAAMAGLAGCAQPQEDPNVLVGYCPQWIPGDLQTASFDITGAAVNHTFEPTQLEVRGKPFDALRLRLTRLDGLVTLRAYDGNGSDLGIRDHDAQEGVQALLRLAEAQAVPIDVYLTSVAADEPPRPGPITLEWATGAGTASGDYEVRYLYRVCGAITDRRES